MNRYNYWLWWFIAWLIAWRQVRPSCGGVVGTHRKYGSKKSDHSYRMCVSSMNRQTHDFIISSSSLLLSITFSIMILFMHYKPVYCKQFKVSRRRYIKFPMNRCQYAEKQTHGPAKLLYLSFQLNYWLQLDCMITARVIYSLFSIDTCFSDFIFTF